MSTLQKTEIASVSSSTWSRDMKDIKKNDLDHKHLKVPDMINRGILQEDDEIKVKNCGLRGHGMACGVKALV